MSRQRFSSSASRPNRAFTIVELLVVVVIALILLAIFIPYGSALREQDRRVRCAENLRQLRNALQQYADDNNHEYPRVTYDLAARPAGYSSFTGIDAGSAFATLAPPPTTLPATQPTTASASIASVASNDVTASLWLLVRGSYVRNLALFVCPSTGNDPDSLTDAAGRPVAANRRGNFRSSSNLGYSYADPFSIYYKDKLSSDNLDARFALMADRSPGAAAAQAAIADPPLKRSWANTNNHKKAGQNVLRADGSVSFETTAYCGWRDPAKPTNGPDNIYTALSPTPLLPGESPPPDAPGVCSPTVGAAYQRDSYLVPTQDEGR